MSSTRKRGAQIGNRNAYKHGFYAHNFSILECSKLSRDPDLESEVKAARIIADRIMDRISGKGLAPEDSGEIDEPTLRSINTLANVWLSISTLARSHQLIEGSYKPVETAILDALKDINIVEGYNLVCDLTERARVILRSPYNLAFYGGGITLRPYQVEPIDAILSSIIEKAGRTFVIIISRQSGKDELLCHLKVFLLQRFQQKDKEIVEFNPTYKPQTIRSIERLENRMTFNVITRGRWKKRSDFMRYIGQAKVSFLSGDGQANVVGATASLLLIINEAQDISTTKYDRDCAPMAASTNATRVIVGTAWTSNTLLARELRAARIAEKADGIRRVFIYDSDEVRKHNPPYGIFVDSEVARLGRDHPLIRTQYFCEEIDAQLGMFNPARRALMQGDTPGHSSPVLGQTYAFLLDVAGQDEARMNAGDDAPLANPGRDLVSLTIATVDLSTLATLQAPTYRFVNRQQWTGQNHLVVFSKMKSLVESWKPQHIVIDATGVGEGLYALLDKAFPGRVIPVKFTQQVKSETGWRYLAIIETGRVRDCCLTDPVRLQYDACQSEILPGPAKTLRWGVPEGAHGPDGELIHDDYLLANALIADLDRLEWYVSTDIFTAEGFDPLQRI